MRHIIFNQGWRIEINHSFNIARMYGLHNVKHVIDLDPQGYIKKTRLDIDDPNPDLDSVNEYFDVLPS